MPTPPMLQQTNPTARAAGPDPLVSVNIVGMTLLCLGLLLAGVLAVYDYSTPGAEAPLVLCIAVLAVALLVVDVVVMTIRHARRVRLGL